MRRVYVLHQDEPRCRPSGYCDRQDTCLRYKADLPATGAKVINGLSGRSTMMGIELGCADWLAIPHDDRVP